MNETTTGRERRGESGFTLAELMVSMAVMVVVLVAMLFLFDATNKMAHAETNVADTQQSVRIGQDEIVRLVREVARGWEVGGANRMDPAKMIEIEDNVPAGRYMGTGSDPALKVLPGTDIIHLRGVMRSSLYYTQSAGIPGGASGCTGTADNSWNTCDASSFAGTTNPILTFPACPSWSNCAQPSGKGFVQDTSKLTAQAGDQVFLVSSKAEVAMYPVSDWSNGQMTLDTSTPKVGPWTTGNGGYSLTTDPTILNAPVKLAALFEDFAIYVRENNGQPRLSIARYVPGTSATTKDPFEGDASNLKQDIADDIVDLQVAQAIGTPNTSTYTWYCNVPAGSACVPPSIDNTHSLFYLRVSVMGRGPGRDFHYVAPAIAAIENHSYNEAAQPVTSTDIVTRSYHRRLLRTVVDARNL